VDTYTDEDLEPCAECKRRYPSEILSPFNGKMTCGICALELTNQLHGTHRTHFDGETAEDMRMDAVVWRSAHPVKS
jgi:hypothetical protein